MPAVIGVLILIIVGLAGNLFVSSNINSYTSKPIPTSTIVPVPTIETPTPTLFKEQSKGINTNQNLIDCIGPDGKQFKTSMSECKGLNEKWGNTLDYMVDCNFSAECGGPRYVKKSECVNCTKTNSGTNTAPAVIYVTSAPSASKTPVFLSYSGYTIYCPSQNVGAVMSINSTMESKKTEWAKNYDSCIDLYYKTNSCPVACGKTSTDGYSLCYATYGYTGDSYQACIKEVGDNYSTCLSKCSPNSAESCQYFNAEQKSLSAQITNLCK